MKIFPKLAELIKVTLAHKTEKRIIGFRNGLIRTELYFSGILLALPSYIGFIHRLASFMMIMVPKVVVTIPGLTSPPGKTAQWYEPSFPYQLL